MIPTARTPEFPPIDTTGKTLPAENWRENSVRVGVLAYRGNGGDVSHFLRFEENLTITPGGNVPVAQIVVIFENNMSPAAGFATEADGMTHNAIDTTADQPGYSSLWNHSVGDKANFAAVHDYPSALANVMAANVGVDVNCPEVR